METATHILIFKTNIATPDDLLRVKAVLDTQHLITQWNVDQMDVDCVLRVVSCHHTIQDINLLINELGYTCMELPD